MDMWPEWDNESDAIYDRWQEHYHERHPRKYRVRRQDDNGNVYTVPHEGVWHDDLAKAEAIKRALEQRPHKQDYWIEDDEGRMVSRSLPR